MTTNEQKLLDELPPLDCYWNPGEETISEKLKQQVTQKISEAGGILSQVFGRLANSSVGILTYHRVTDKIEGVSFPTINVTPDTFRQQLTGLQSIGFRFASLQTVLDATQNGHELPERTVVLTFDDIYDNVFLNAFPVLCELNIPATCFLSTAFVDSPEPFLFDPWAMEHQADIPQDSWLPITSEHVTEMVASGLIEFGAHTHTHQDFRDRPEDFQQDLECGMEELERLVGSPPQAFAFPYGIPRDGFCNPELMDAVMDLDLQCGLTTRSQTNGLDTSPFGWGRFHVFEHDTPLALAAKLDGWYEWLPKLKDTLVSSKNACKTFKPTERTS